MFDRDDPTKDAVPQTNNDKANSEMAPAAYNQSPLDRKKNLRGRSLSVPCRGESSDVDTVMIKAKRASAYLWTLLHSQVGPSQVHGSSRLSGTMVY